MQRFFEFFDSVFPVRAESQASSIAVWLDRIIYVFILLTALSAPLSIAATNIAWLSGMFFWLPRSLIKPRPKLFRSPIDLALFALFAWSLISSFLSYAPDLSLDRLRVLTLFPIAYLVCQNVRSRKTVKFLVGALIVSTMTTVIWTFVERGFGRGVQVFEVSTSGPLFQAGIQNADTLLKINGKKFSEPEELIAALEQNETIKLNFYRPDYYADVEIKRENLSPGASVIKKLGFERWQRSRNWRSSGFYNHYTTYAEVLQLILSLMFGIFLTLPNKKSVFGAVLLFCLILAGAALLLTGTRASQAAFLLSALAIVVTGASRKVLFGLIALCLPLAIVAAIYVQNTRNTSFVDASDNSTTWRLTVWHEGVELLTKSPRHLIFGVGIDSVKRYKCDWGLFDNCTLPAGHFHSTPLQIAVETGLPALFLWLLIVWQYGRSLLTVILRDMGTWGRGDAGILDETEFQKLKMTKEKRNSLTNIPPSPRPRVSPSQWTLPISASKFERGVLLGTFGGLIGFFASGVVHYNLGDSEVAMVFYLVMGLALVLIRDGNPTIKESVLL